jgi:hypothetical protein
LGKNGGATELLPDNGLLILFAIIAAQAAGVARLGCRRPCVAGLSHRPSPQGRASGHVKTGRSK